MKVDVPCLCPQKQRHKADTISLYPALGFRSAVAIRNEVGVLFLEEPNAGYADILAACTQGYLHHGIESWTLRDKDGPIPVSRENIDRYLLSKTEIAMEVGDKADDLYREQVMLPLLRKGLQWLQPSQTDDSTSPPEDSLTSTESPSESETSSTLRPVPLKPSLTTGSRTAGTARISESPGGDSNSSQKSA